jgi:hypothetical protein
MTAFSIKSILAVILLGMASHSCFAISEHDLNRSVQEIQICPAAVIEWVIAAAKISTKNKQPVASEFITAAACKENPDDKNTGFIALAYDAGSKKSTALLFAVLDMTHQKILSRYDGEIIGLAGMNLESGNLRIDTGRYFLSKHVRAFGLDITGGYQPSCADGGIGAERILYVREGNKIRPVLYGEDGDGLTMSYWYFIQRGNDRCNDAADDIATIIESFDLNLSVADTSTNGFHDLLVTAKSSRDDNKKSRRKPFHYVLKYDGKKYPIKKLLNSFDAWSR